MTDYKKEVDALSVAFAPVVETYCDASGALRADVDTRQFMEACWDVIKDRQAMAARFASVGVYHHAKLDPAEPLALVDPAPRRGLARLLPPKRVIIRNANALMTDFEVSLAQSVNHQLHLIIAPLLFFYLFSKTSGISAEEVAAMGPMAAWSAHQHAMEALKMARDLGM
jgi:hypothetical protein